VTAAFRQGDVRSLPFSTRSFDMVIDFGTCYHCRSPERALMENAGACLKPVGSSCTRRPPASSCHTAIRTRGVRLPWRYGARAQRVAGPGPLESTPERARWGSPLQACGRGAGGEGCRRPPSGDIRQHPTQTGGCRGGERLTKSSKLVGPAISRGKGGGRGGDARVEDPARFAYPPRCYSWT